MSVRFYLLIICKTIPAIVSQVLEMRGIKLWRTRPDSAPVRVLPRGFGV